MSTLDDLAAEILGTLSNAALKLDPLTEPRLAELEGSAVRFEVLTPGSSTPLRIMLTVRKASMTFSPGDDSPVNAVVSGTLPDLLAWLKGRAEPGLGFSGDEALLARLAGIFERFEPDLAAPLNRLIGPDGAAAVLGLAEAALAATRSALQAVGSAAGETARAGYAGTDEFEEAVASLEALQLRIDRLGARLARLEARSPEQGTPP